MLEFNRTELNRRNLFCYFQENGTDLSSWYRSEINGE